MTNAEVCIEQGTSKCRILFFKRPGVQNGVFRKLKQGRYEAEARLNLHRMGVERARREVFEFILQAEQYGMRSVLVIHGKGEHGEEREQASLIKGCVDHWLRQIEQVQAFHSARPQHGIGFDFELFGKAGLNFDLGVLWQGDPIVMLDAVGPATLPGHPRYDDLQLALVDEQEDLQDVISDLKAYPVISVGFVYNF